MSENSQAAGNDKKRRNKRDGKADQASEPAGNGFRVDLVVHRLPHVIWAVLAGGVGIFCLMYLQDVARGAGFVLTAVGLWHAYWLILSLLKSPGHVAVSDEWLVLPSKTYDSNPKSIKRDTIKQVFFLRRSPPMFQTPPVLVVETENAAFKLPRDWFASEEDQKKIALAAESGLS